MSLIVKVPEPCHEDWNNMNPDEKGRFCNVCSKSVHDFSNKSDTYIHKVLASAEPGKVCGRFNNSQINRPLILSIPFELLPKNLSRLNVFAIALFFAFGTVLFSCSNDKGQTLGDIRITDVPIQNSDYIVGQSVGILDSIYMDSLKDIAPVNTAFTEGATTLGVSFVEPPEVVVIPEEIPNIQFPIMGEVSYERPISLEKDSIQMDSTSNRVVADSNEKFSLIVYPNPSNGEFNLSYEVKQKGLVYAAIYDMNGNLVQVLIDSQVQHTGKYILPFDLVDIANGIYLCKVIVNDQLQHTEIVLTK